MFSANLNKENYRKLSLSSRFLFSWTRNPSAKKVVISPSFLTCFSRVPKLRFLVAFLLFTAFIVSAADAPNGIAILIGMNIAPNYVTQQSIFFSNLDGCLKDVKLMQELAAAKGFEVMAPITEKSATYYAVDSAISSAAMKLEKGDLLLLYYSGHGEHYGGNQTWCLYDKRIQDKELAKLWGKFRPGVKIVVISDSCHNGTIIAIVPGKPGLNGYLTKVCLKNNSRAIVAGGKIGFVIPKELQSYFRSRNIRYTPKLHRLIEVPNNSETEIHANVISLSPCMDLQEAEDKSDGGVFTKTLISIVKNDPKISYKRLHDEIEKKLQTTDKIPVLGILSSNTSDFKHECFLSLTE